MNIEKLTKEFHTQLKELIEVVIKNLENPRWLICLSKKEIDEIFDNDKAIIYGVIDDNKLLAISGLFFDETDFTDIVKLLNIEGSKVAEISESMTLPEARGNNYMLKINSLLVQKAKDLGFEYLIAPAAPENISSNISLKKLGMTCLG